MNTSDAPAASTDKVSEQQDQESWVAQIFKNIEKDAASRPAQQDPMEGPKMASPQMVAMENSGTLPCCRTSCRG